MNASSFFSPGNVFNDRTILCWTSDSVTSDFFAFAGGVTLDFASGSDEAELDATCALEPVSGREKRFGSDDVAEATPGLSYMSMATLSISRSRRAMTCTRRSVLDSYFSSNLMRERDARLARARRVRTSDNTSGRSTGVNAKKRYEGGRQKGDSQYIGARKRTILNGKPNCRAGGSTGRRGLRSLNQSRERGRGFAGSATSVG